MDGDFKKRLINDPTRGGALICCLRQRASAQAPWTKLEISRAVTGTALDDKKS